MKLAEMLGIFPRTLSKKLKGDSHFTVEEAIMIQEQWFSEISVNELFKRNVFQYKPDGTYVSSSGYKKGIYTFNLTQARKIKVIFSKDSSSSGTSWINVSEVTGFHIFADYGDVQFSQDDEQFFGLPFLTESGIASPFNGKNSVWTMDRDF